MLEAPQANNSLYRHFSEWHRVRKYSFGKSLPSELFSCTCSRIVCSKFAIIVFTNTIKRERHDIVIIECTE